MLPPGPPPPDLSALRTIAAHVAQQTQVTTSIAEHLERVLAKNEAAITAGGRPVPSLATRLLDAVTDLQTVHAAALQVTEQLRLELQIVTLRQQELDVRQQLVAASEEGHAELAAKFVEVTSRLAEADARMADALAASDRRRATLVMGMAALLVVPSATYILLRAFGL